VDCVGEPPITNILRGPNDSSIRAMAEDGQACLREVFVRGDPNGDGSFNITDPIFVLGFLFLGGPEPSCAKTADADDSGGPLNLTDAIFLLNWLFLGGPNPRPPFPDCRPDPTPDGLDCDRFVCGA
jgi:hypothetical protein